MFYRLMYGTAPRAYNRTLSVFPSSELRVVSGSQPKLVAKLLNQANKL